MEWTWTILAAVVPNCPAWEASVLESFIKTLRMTRCRALAWHRLERTGRAKVDADREGRKWSVDGRGYDRLKSARCRTGYPLCVPDWSGCRAGRPGHPRVPSRICFGKAMFESCAATAIPA